jgi:hypothetical protein
MIIFVYVTVALGVFGIAVWAISLLGKKAKTGWWIGWMVVPAFSILFMIKLRCMTEAYPCGFMSFTGGFTWHLVLGFVVFIAMWALSGAVLNCVYPINWADWMGILGRSMIPLVGLWLAVVWEVLPVSLIHPPTHGGPCPFLPIVCHDTPLMGFGGLAYWAGPFVLWAAVFVCRDVKHTIRERQL